MGYYEILKEIDKHGVTNFEVLKLDHPAVVGAIDYLTELKREEMAMHLVEMANDELIRVGPVEGFLAAVAFFDEAEYIVISNVYPDHTTVDEYAISLVHEIGATKPFRQTEDENEILAFGVTKWLGEQKTVEKNTAPEEIKESVEQKKIPDEPKEEKDQAHKVSKNAGVIEDGKMTEDPKASEENWPFAQKETDQGAPQESTMESSDDEDIDSTEEGERSLILVVDDERAFVKIVTKYLELGGYNVINAGNGKEAIEKAFKEKPNLIVMDLMMPVMNGLEATKAIRSKLETASIPIIILTAQDDEKAELKSKEEGADDYLAKPFDRKKLLAKVQTLLKRKVS